MDECRALAEAGAPEFCAVQARVQHAGRGRGGRSWQSPPGNLHLTVLLRPALPTHRLPEIGFVVGLAVAGAVDQLTGRRTSLKWPNDVLFDGAKLAGVLLETLSGGAVLAGIGANVTHVPPGLPYAATSLAALGSVATADGLAELVLNEIELGLAFWRATSFQAVLARWLQRGPALGSALQVREGSRRSEGRFAGLCPDGALLLDTDSGQRRIVAGDVHSSSCAAPPPTPQRTEC